MKLLIDIPKNIYECVKKSIISDEIFDEIVEAFRHGTPLPKGHGRLIDADEFIKEVENLPKEPNGYSKVYDETKIIMMIEATPTIIEQKTRIRNDD